MFALSELKNTIRKEFYYVTHFLHSQQFICIHLELSLSFSKLPNWQSFICKNTSQDSRLLGVLCQQDYSLDYRKLPSIQFYTHVFYMELLEFFEDVLLCIFDNRTCSLKIIECKVFSQFCKTQLVTCFYLALLKVSLNMTIQAISTS